MEEERSLKYYYDFTLIIVLVPIGIFLVVAIVYNILVAISTWWMYNHATGEKSSSTQTKDDKELKEIKPADDHVDDEEKLTSSNKDKDSLNNVPRTSFWEELFIVNIKLSKFLLGRAVKVKDFDCFIALKIHDTVVSTPLAVIFIQVCQIALIGVLIVILMTKLFIQESNLCSDKYDCYDDLTDLSSLPVGCTNTTIGNLTCFRIEFTPIIAISITGGFIKIVPTVLFSTLTYYYTTVYKRVHNFLGKKTKTSKLLTIVVVEATILFGGASFIVASISDEDYFGQSFMISTPMSLPEQLRMISLVAAYFLISSFLWCLYPRTNSCIRYYKSAWKIETSNKINEQSMFSASSKSALLKLALK